MKKIIRFIILIAAVIIRMSESLPSSSKFSSPPSIANVARHKEWIQHLIDLDVPEITDRPSWKKLISDIKAAADSVPLKIQTHANQYSLKPTVPELALQASMVTLPGAKMAGAPDGKLVVFTPRNNGCQESCRSWRFSRNHDTGLCDLSGWVEQETTRTNSNRYLFRCVE